MILFVAIETLALAAIVMPPFLSPVSDRKVDEFAAASGIRVTPATRPFLAWYLTTGRRLRMLLVVAALFLPNLVQAVLGVGGNRWGDTPLSWQLVFAACLAGTLLAELALTRPSGAHHTASLVPREPAAYLGRVLRWGPTVVGLVGAAVWAAVPALPDPRGGWDLSPVTSAAIGVALGLAVAGLAPLTARWILRRPQPVAADDLVLADHAVRAASVRSVAAVATLMGLLNLAGGLALYTRPFAGSADTVLAVAVIALLAAALVAWGARKPGEAPIVRALRSPSRGGAAR